MTAPLEILNRHVRLLNNDVRRGHFAPMVTHFSEDAEMHFEASR